MVGDEDGETGDEVAGASADSSGCGAGVLGEDRRGLTSEDAVIACGCRVPLGRAGSANVGECQQSSWVRLRGVTCPSVSVKR